MEKDKKLLEKCMEHYVFYRNLMNYKGNYKNIDTLETIAKLVDEYDDHNNIENIKNYVSISEEFLEKEHHIRAYVSIGFIEEYMACFPYCIRDIVKDILDYYLNDETKVHDAMIANKYFEYICDLYSESELSCYSTQDRCKMCWQFYVPLINSIIKDTD